MRTGIFGLGLAALAVSTAVPAFAQGGWQPYHFQPNERYRYTLKWVQGGEASEGNFSVAILPAEGGKLKVKLDGKLGDMECNSTVTADSAEAIPQQMMMGCVMLAPAVMLFAGPSIGYLAGRELGDADEWSMSHGGESVSFRVEGNCSHAGQSGKLAVMRHNDQVRMKSCVGKLAMPLAMSLLEEGGDSIEATLIEYGR